MVPSYYDNKAQFIFGDNLRYIWIALIKLYQHYISPYKGFSCAHVAVHKGDSCSEAIKKIIAKHGILTGRKLIKTRFNECTVAYQSLEKSRKNKKKRENCCDHCDALSCLPDKTCDIASDLPCDCNPF